MRLANTEQSKYELDRQFITKQIQNVTWQISAGIEARISSKNVEETEVDRQMVQTNDRLYEWRDKLAGARNEIDIVSG
mgnify:CR=1 FL=1